MIIAQFGSSTNPAFPPVWLAALGDLTLEADTAARDNFVELGEHSYAVDMWGENRAPMAVSALRVSGQTGCNRSHTLSEAERALRRLVGLKDWLIAARPDECRCGKCGPILRCCFTTGSQQRLRWFARRSRFSSCAITGDGEVRLSFNSLTPWQAMTERDWYFGRPLAQQLVPTDACAAPDILKMAWPRIIPPGRETPLRFYQRPALTWPQAYCVGNWSAGRWIRAHIGGEAVIQVPGDFFPQSALAFTNFTRLTVTICSSLGESSFSFNQLIGEPQYVLVRPGFAEVRYCPLEDDECLQAPGPLYEQVAKEGAPIAFSNLSDMFPGRLWPGKNVLRFSGFRLPNHPFAFSYDIRPQYL